MFVIVIEIAIDLLLADFDDEHKSDNLLLPPAAAEAATRSRQTMRYVLVDDTTKSSTGTSAFAKKFYQTADSARSRSRRTASSGEPTLLERLRYNVTIETQGPTRVTMVFTPATNEQLYAELDGKVNAVNNQGTANVYGEISISSRSYYNFFKRFDATGKLKFVGTPTNPELAITATYQAFRQNPLAAAQTGTAKDTTGKKTAQPTKVIVELTIGGTRNVPQIAMGMKVELEPGKDPIDWSTQAKGGDVQSDAISFILTGKFRDELTAQEKATLLTDVGPSAGSSVVSGFTSNLLSGILTDYLRQEFPFIRSAEVTYAGGSIQEGADLRISGEAFNGYWRFGGRILNNIGNANISYQVSLGDVFNTKTIRNLYIELERRVEGTEFSEDKITNAARVYYRFSF